MLHATVLAGESDGALSKTIDVNLAAVESAFGRERGSKRRWEDALFAEDAEPVKRWREVRLVKIRLMLGLTSANASARKLSL
jgi:hypothetical protein